MHSSTHYQSYRLDWRGLEIEIRYCPDWTSGMRVAHIEVESACRSPLPITETGYRSLFTNADLVEKLGGAVGFVEHWLDEGGCRRLEARRANEKTVLAVLGRLCPFRV